MKRILVSLFALSMVLVMVSCAGPEPSPSPTPTPTAMSEPTPMPTTIPEPTLTPRPADMSYTTGLHYEGEYKPVMAVIENSLSARPQTGLQTADVVYEVPVEGSITRFVCIFSDSVPEEAMPIRSGRVNFLDIQQEWDAILMHFGGSGDGKSGAPWFTFYGNELHAKEKIDLDGLYDKDDRDYFYRVKNKKAPHNVMGNPALAQKQYDYSPRPLDWKFDNSIAYPGADVSEIKLSMCSKDENYVSYEYDAVKDVYLRFMGGKIFKSAETGEQVSVKNVIVQHSTYQQIDVYKVWNLTGSGNAEFYIGGKLIKGTWSKESPNSQTMYYDNKGEPIICKMGNTWIHISPEA